MSLGIARAFPGALVAVLIWCGCGTSRPLHASGPDADGHDPGGVDAGDRNTGGDVPGAEPDALPRDLLMPELYCPECNGACGDGVLRPIEQCDDGNKTGGDGCTPLCQIEQGWTCPVPGMPCIPDPNPDANPNP